MPVIQYVRMSVPGVLKSCIWVDLEFRPRNSVFGFLTVFDAQAGWKPAFPVIIDTFFVRGWRGDERRAHSRLVSKHLLFSKGSAPSADYSGPKPNSQLSILPMMSV